MCPTQSAQKVAKVGAAEGDLVITHTPPCQHNAWKKQKYISKQFEARLVCFVCEAAWNIRINDHAKCSEFYAGTCLGNCGNPHIYKKGTKYEQFLLSLRKVQNKRKRAENLEATSTSSASSTSGGSPGPSQLSTSSMSPPRLSRMTSACSVDSASQSSFDACSASSHMVEATDLHAKLPLPSKPAYYRNEPYSQFACVEYVGCL